uniref:Uncharacterized protein n=1 Tax=Proboscia inermis TaxID=420281 RepID=A0A7S0C733_9STRA
MVVIEVQSRAKKDNLELSLSIILFSSRLSVNYFCNNPVLLHASTIHTVPKDRTIEVIKIVGKLLSELKIIIIIRARSEKSRVKLVVHCCSVQIKIRDESKINSRGHE